MALDDLLHWVKEAYKSEWPTLGNHLVSSVLSMGSSAYVASCIDDPVVSSSLASVVDMGVYWGTFLPQLFYRDREQLKNKEGKICAKGNGFKFAEYSAMMCVMEGLYLAGRGYVQCRLQESGIDPSTASVVSQLGLSTFFTGVLPLVRYGLRELFEKKNL